MRTGDEHGLTRRVVRQNGPVQNAAEGPPIAWRGLTAVAATFAALLIATSGRYGYHRDELYFIEAGSHPAFGYTDQPPLVPLLAQWLDEAFGHSLVWLRVPSALAGAVTVLLCGLMAREFGDGKRAQLLAAACFAVSSIAVTASHLLSTTTFDLLSWALLSWLLIRVIRDRSRSWLPVGLVAGLGLEVKTLVVFFALAVVVSMLAVGPRDVLRSRSLWLAAGLALLIWSPNLWWQATHEWPQLELSSAIASGSSGTSEPRWLFLPFQLVLISPLLFPIWLAGWWRLATDTALASYRFFPVAYVVLAAAFLLTGGKPYYLTGMYPVLLAAGAAPVVEWAARGGRRLRTGLLAAAVALTLAISCVLFLPVVPADRLADTPIVAVNYDAGETVGWPEFAAAVAQAYDELPPADRQGAVVLAGNYGEAGAVERFRPGLAPVYSGHNAYWDWGPPPTNTSTVIAVGYAEADLQSWFGEVQRAGTIDNGLGLDNDEQGKTIWACRSPRQSWTKLWPEMRRLG